MFIAYVEQKMEGCDYTIGCGQALWRLKANSLDEAIEELKRKVLGEWLPEYGCYEEGHWDESELNKITLFRIASEEVVPVRLWYKEANKLMEQTKHQAKKDKEKAEFLRLSKKYDKEKAEFLRLSKKYDK